MYIYSGTRASRRKKHGASKVAAAVGFIIVFLILGRISLSEQGQNTVSPVDTSGEKNPKNTKALQSRSAQKRNPEELKQHITSLVGTSLKNYSVYVEDLSGEFTVGIAETVIFDAASVNKIPILAALYHKAQDDPLLLEQTVTPQPHDIQDYGTGIIQYDPPGKSYTIQTLARLMMQKSDNTAAYILSKYTLGLSNIQKLMNELGLEQTDMMENRTSNKDMSILMKHLYSGQVTSPALTKEVLAFMKDSDFEERIPAKLPTGTVVYHKIGNYAGGYHDVGIVQMPSGDAYFIGIMTQDIDDTDTTIELMADISALVYEFML